MVENTTKARVEALAEDIEDQVGETVESFEEKENELYVSIEGLEYQPMAGMDTICVIAYDHGFIPQGIIDSGAARFTPRTDI